MTSTMKWILVFFVLSAIIPIASAYTVSQISVSPSGDLTPGTGVTVSFTIQFSGSGDETFPSSDTLELYTELDQPKWTSVLLLNDIENPQPGENKKTYYLSGWILAYNPSDVPEENLRVTLQGNAPSVTATANKTIFRVQQLDSRNNVVSGSTVAVSRMVINTAEVTSMIAARESDLEVFRTHLDEKEVLGVDTAAAEEKYSAAQAALNDAKSRPSSQYTAAQASLTNTQNLITEGENLLNKAWAEKEVADAQEPITKTDELITWLKPNATSGDPKTRLTEITTKREIAAGLVTSANDQIFAGNYDRAREKAGEAFTKGNETYNDALSLKKELSSGFQLPLPKLPGGTLLIIAAVVIIVVAAVGYVIYRKRTQWDELG